MIRWFEKKRYFSIIFFILIAIEIFIFSSISGAPGLKNVLNVSVIYHFCVFFLLNFFLMMSLNGSKNLKIKYLIISLVFSLIYSILDEIHQIFVPFRSPDFFDILTDNIGIFSSTLLYLYRKR